MPFSLTFENDADGRLVPVLVPDVSVHPDATATLRQLLSRGCTIVSDNHDPDAPTLAAFANSPLRDTTPDERTDTDLQDCSECEMRQYEGAGCWGCAPHFA